MFKLRLALIKGEDTKYVGHLDLGRALERAMRRAKLPVAYSEGFNPHMKMAFGPALAVGVSSLSEYADVEMTEELPIADVVAALRQSLPPGLALQEARWVDTRGSLSALLNIAVYQLRFSGWTAVERQAAMRALEAFQAAPEAVHVRRSPKGVRTLDLKTVLHGDIVLAGDGEALLSFAIHMEKGSAKPQEVLSVLQSQFAFPGSTAAMCRTRLYHEMNGITKLPFEI